jgi:hypothetical protein
VAVPFEQSTANDARDFVDAIAEEKAALVDGELRFATWQELTVEVDD